MAPAYVVINHPQRAVPTGAVAGIYSRLRQIPRLDPAGPPLPLIVQCLPGDILDLEPIAQIIEEIKGGAVPTNHEEFVKDVIGELETESLSVLPHINLFYGIISSRIANKYIAAEWPEADDPAAVYHIFPTFIRAFIYVLAGGNDNLKKWGLKNFMGIERPKKTPPTRGPVMLSELLASVKGLARKGKERARDDASLSTVSVSDSSLIGQAAVVVHDHGEAPPLQDKVIDKVAITDTPNTLPVSGKPVGVPDSLVPLAYLEKIGGSVPFMFRRKVYGGDLVYAHKPDALQFNGPFRSVPGQDLLPPLVLFYLRSHGWSDRVIEVVSIAHSCEASLPGFLTTMANENMPLTEASYVWHALKL